MTQRGIVLCQAKAVGCMVFLPGYDLPMTQGGHDFLLHRTAARQSRRSRFALGLAGLASLEHPACRNTWRQFSSQTWTLSRSSLSRIPENFRGPCTARSSDSRNLGYFRGPCKPRTPRDRTCAAKKQKYVKLSKLVTTLVN